MNRVALSILLVLSASTPMLAQAPSDAFSQALAQGDLYQSRKKFDLALDAYHKADKLCHHSSAACYLKLANIERKLGDFPSALDDAKRSGKVAGDNKTAAVQAHLFRATLLTQLSGKPTDKKLKEAEDELRQAITLDPSITVSRFDLGMVLLKQERDSEGLAEMNAYLEAPNADPATVAEARRIIASPIRAREPFAPDFSFTAEDNQQISNASLRGKVVLLDFWGTWCPPCRESIPTVRGLQKKYSGKNVQIVGISSDDDEAVWRTFIKAQQMTWLEYIDLSSTVQEAFKIESFPTYIVLDKDGVIRFRQSGFGEDTGANLEEALNKALKRESDPKLLAAANAAPTQHPAPAESPVKPDSNHKSASNAAVGELASAPSAPTDSTSVPASPYSGLEGGSTSGFIYKNPVLQLSYEFPHGWNAATPESLHAANENAEATVKSSILQKHPEIANSVDLNVAKIIFYGSRRGNWDGRHYDLPSIRIAAAPSHMDELTLEDFRRSMQVRTATAGMNPIGESYSYEVNQHEFFRADFDHAIGGLHVTQSVIQTLAGDYMLSIEIYAASPDELKTITDSLKTMSITDDDE